MKAVTHDVQIVHQKTHQNWWARRSKRARIILVAAILTFIALAVGLGLGLGLGLRKSADDNEQSAAGPNSEPGSPSTNLTSISPTPSENSRIFRPKAGATWQIVLLNPIALSSDASTITPDADVFDIDLFTNNKSTIDVLHRLGKKVICYFSAGSYEPNRPDSAEFQPSDMGNELVGWPGEKWLNLRSENVKNIMMKRMQLAADKGCDGVDPDNMDAYNNTKTGVNMTPQDSINFMGYLSGLAASLNLAIGLKNAQQIIPQVLPGIQYAVNEQCTQYQECQTWDPFIEANKPVFHIEYTGEVNPNAFTNFCGINTAGGDLAKFSTVLKHMNLDGWVQYCNGSQATTSLDTSSSGRTGKSDS